MHILASSRHKLRISYRVITMPCGGGVMYTRTATYNGELLVYKSSQLSSIIKSPPISESDRLCYLYAKTDE